MSESTMRIIIGIAILGHGLGHSMGLFPIFDWTFDEKNWKPDSWLLTKLIGMPLSKVLGFLIWTAAMVMGVMAGLAVFDWLVPQAWFKDLAVWSSVVSLVGLFLFPKAFVAFFNRLGAIVVDVILLVTLLWIPWEPISGIG